MVGKVVRPRVASTQGRFAFFDYNRRVMMTFYFNSVTIVPLPNIISRRTYV